MEESFAKVLSKDLWIQPSAGDAGGAVGAALTAWHKLEGKPRTVNGSNDSMQGSFLGPSYSNEEIAQFLKIKRSAVPGSRR